MFARVPEARSESVEIVVDGAPVRVPVGATVAAALLGLGTEAFRKTPARGLPRGPFCLMGACFDCLVTIDGLANRRSCLVPVRPGIRIETGGGAPDPGAPELSP